MPKKLNPNRLLVLRYRTWHCQVEVPRPLRATMGKKRLVVSLQTHDLFVARLRRDDAEKAFKAAFDAERRRLGPNTVVAQALEWRERLAKLAQGDERTIGGLYGFNEQHFPDGQPMTPREVAEQHADHMIGDHIDHIRDTHGEAAAATFMDVAQGRATPILHGVDGWLAEGGARGLYDPRSAQGFRSVLKEVAAWAAASGVPQTVEAFTRQVVGRFVQASLSAPGSNRMTINRKLSAVSSYWRWLEKRGHVEANPWLRQSLPKVRKAPEDRERPFTHEEVRNLLDGPAGPEMADAMRVALFTGARLEAIYSLTVGACRGGWFVIPPQKKEPGARRVPIHPEIVEVVARRCEGKRAGDFLFHEPGPARVGRERSMMLSKRFRTYRERADVNVTDKREGVRRDLVNFHSFRRTFSTLAEQAGQPPHIISAVIGHKEGRAGMTLGTYSGGPSDEQLRVCVQAVSI